MKPSKKVTEAQKALLQLYRETKTAHNNEADVRQRTALRVLVEAFESDIARLGLTPRVMPTLDSEHVTSRV